MAHAACPKWASASSSRYCTTPAARPPKASNWGWATMSLCLGIWGALVDAGGMAARAGWRLGFWGGVGGGGGEGGGGCGGAGRRLLPGGGDRPIARPSQRGLAGNSIRWGRAAHGAMALGTTDPRIKPRSIRKIKSIKTTGATCGEMSTPRHLHPHHENRAHGLGAVVVGIRSHGRYAPEHVLEVAGDGD